MFLPRFFDQIANQMGMHLSSEPGAASTVKRYRFVAFEEQTEQKAGIESTEGHLKLKACKDATKAQEWTRVYGNGLRNVGT